MTEAERVALRRLLDDRRRQLVAVKECAYPPCGREFAPHPRAPFQRFCCHTHKTNDHHRRNGTGPYRYASSAV